MQRFTAGLVQMTSGADKEENLATATRLVEEAARRGADFVVLPELWTCLADPETIRAHAEPIPGPISQAMSDLARRWTITLVAGSIAERADGTEKVYNTSLVFSPVGEQIGLYRKMHLFDIDLPGVITHRESAFLAPGDQISVVETPVGRVGQATCYDLRFPELFRRLIDEGAELFAVPSAFTQATGRDHWDVLLRARAVENQVHVIAPDQFGRHTSKLTTYGRSMIVDPWGTPLTQVPDGEGVAVAEIDPDRQEQVRQRLPALQHRRLIDRVP